MNLIPAIRAAGESGQILPSAVENLELWCAASLPKWAADSLGELVAGQEWGELNDRFYKNLAFGTGGMRGRTIGEKSAAAELGKIGPQGTPEHAAVGSNILNDFTLIRAVIGLFRYVKAHLDGAGNPTPPKIVIAHDVRHFSRHFCELAASVWTRLGGDAFIFDGPRSTPQLSYTVRWLDAHCGVVITASHNPPHDNGFKAYFDDGAQVVPPHDKGIVEQVSRVSLDETGAFLEIDLARVVQLGKSADDAYFAVAQEALIDAKLLRESGLKISYTNIHGTGGVMSVPLLEAAGCQVVHEPTQAVMDPRFPSVKSPNPENAEALTLAVRQAEAQGLDVVMATDPDGDRMGVAVRGRDGKLHLLTGNQVGVLLTDYRLRKYKELGWIAKDGGDNVALVKTFVTTALQDAIARSQGIKVINTLTGFKWIAEKIRRYEERLESALLERQGIALDYKHTPFAARAKLLQAHSTFYAFGCEESYGYLPNDGVRDKDANAACLMFAEFCAWVKSRNLTVPEALDALYLEHGFHLEGMLNLVYEGATGAAKIKRILDSYRSDPPKAFGDVGVTKFEDFGTQDIRDADGDLVPKENLFFVTLANAYTFAVRGSGTEPKIKFYLFAKAPVAAASELPTVKAAVQEELKRLSALIEADAHRRAE